MEKPESNKKIVKKVLVDRMLKYLNDFSYSLDVYDDSLYVLDIKEYERLKNRFFKIINHNLISEVSYIKEADLSRLDSLYEEHKSYYYENVRTKFNLLDKKLYSDEDIINSGLMVLAEVENIKKIPKLIKSIASKLDEVKVYELTPTVDVLSSKFKEMKKNGASYKDYALLNDNLDNIIRKTYISNISKLSNINNDYDLALVVSEDDDDYHLLTCENIELFSSGYVYKPEDIVSASNDEDDHKFLSYEHLDKKTNVLKVSGKPTAIYALTMGNKSLSSNYRSALTLSSKNKNLEIIEIDVTKYASKDVLDDFKRIFIDELLENKNISINTSKDRDFYSRFDYFFDKYLLLKGSRYDEGNIINLFDFYFNIIYSQKYDNLDYLFSGTLTLDEVGEVLSQNIYHQDNIFRYHQVDEKMIERFISKYGAYYNNEVLNKVYPGIDVIIEKLSNASNEELSKILEVVNSTYKMDSWLISQMLEPTHVISREYTKTEVKSNKYIDSDFYGDFKSFLQSNDGDNQRTR